MPRFNAIFPSTKEADRFIHQLGRSGLEVFLSSQYEKPEGTEVRFRAQLRNFSTEHDEQLARGEVKTLVRRFNGRLIPMKERQEIEELVDGLLQEQTYSPGNYQPGDKVVLIGSDFIAKVVRSVEFGSDDYKDLAVKYKELTGIRPEEVIGFDDECYTVKVFGQIGSPERYLNAEEELAWSSDMMPYEG